MRRWIIFTILVMVSGTLGACDREAYGQAPECPPNLVCITREAAQRALADSDMVAAQKVEIAALKQAAEDFKAELNKMRVNFAEVSGENTALKQAQIRYDAILDLLLKNTKKKCMPLSVCF